MANINGNNSSETLFGTNQADNIHGNGVGASS
jgi:hypothetical protein